MLWIKERNMPRIQPFTPLLPALANPFCSFRFALFISRMQAMRGGLESCFCPWVRKYGAGRLGVLQALAGLQAGRKTRLRLAAHSGFLAFVSSRPGSGQALTPHGPPAWRLPGA